VLVRKNGNRYEGCWENGVSKGRGVFTWRDGSTSFGNWGKKFVNEKRVSMDECNNNNNKSVSFPIICIWELNGEAGDITCDIVEASMIYDGGRVCESDVQLQKSPCGSIDGDVKKPGHTVSKGHMNYDLMLNLQLGIRYLIYIATLISFSVMVWLELDKKKHNKVIIYI